jgi:hypothetical protein
VEHEVALLQHQTLLWINLRRLRRCETKDGVVDVAMLATIDETTVAHPIGCGIGQSEVPGIPACQGDSGNDVADARQQHL